MTVSQNSPKAETVQIVERPPKVTCQIEGGPSIILTGGDAADVLAICRTYLTDTELQDPDLCVEIS